MTLRNKKEKKKERKRWVHKNSIIQCDFSIVLCAPNFFSFFLAPFFYKLKQHNTKKLWMRKSNWTNSYTCCGKFSSHLYTMFIMVQNSFWKYRCCTHKAPLCPFFLHFFHLHNLRFSMESIVFVWFFFLLKKTMSTSSSRCCTIWLCTRKEEEEEKRKEM